MTEQTQLDESVLNIDIQDLTVGEVIEIEDLTGLPLDALGQDDKPKGRMLAALAYISKKRTTPDFTWEMAMDLKVTTAAPVKVDLAEGDA